MEIFDFVAPHTPLIHNESDLEFLVGKIGFKVMKAGGFLAVPAIERNPRTNLDYVDPHNEKIGGIGKLNGLTG